MIEERSYLVIALNFRSRAYLVQVVKIIFDSRIDQSEADKRFLVSTLFLGI